MQFSVPIRLIEIEGSGFHVAVSGFVNGNLANVLIDTGASQTVFDKNRVGLFSKEGVYSLQKADKLSKGLGTDSMEGFRFEIQQFIIGDIVLENYNVVALDLSHINESYQELELNAIDVVLGGDFLKTHNAVIDYHKQLLWLDV